MTGGRKADFTKMQAPNQWEGASLMIANFISVSDGLHCLMVDDYLDTSSSQGKIEMVTYQLFS